MGGLFLSRTWKKMPLTPVSRARIGNGATIPRVCDCTFAPASASAFIISIAQPLASGLSAADTVMGALEN